MFANGVCARMCLWSIYFEKRARKAATTTMKFKYATRIRFFNSYLLFICVKISQLCLYECVPLHTPKQIWNVPFYFDWMYGFSWKENFFTVLKIFSLKCCFKRSIAYSSKSNMFGPYFHFICHYNSAYVHSISCLVWSLWLLKQHRGVLLGSFVFSASQ